MLQTSEPYIRIGRHSELNNLLEISIGSLRKLRCWRVKDICGSLKEGRFVNDKVIEMTENEFIHYQSRMIGHVESVTIEEARECVGEDQELTNTTFRRSRRARKRVNFDEFMCYDDWPGELRLVPMLIPLWWIVNFAQMLEMMSHKLKFCFWCLFFGGRKLRAVISGKQIY